MKNKIIVILVGILFAGIGVFLLVSEAKKGERCNVEVPGKVVDIIEESNYDDGNYSSVYYPAISYQAEGRTIESQYSTGFGNRNKYTVGQEITVLYNPNRPTEYVIKGEKSSNFFGIMFFALGTLATILGVTKKDI